MTAWDLPDPWSRTPEQAVPQPPLFSVLGGNPSAEELAALTAVVMGLNADGGAPRTTPESARRTWNRRRMLSLAPKPGPGSWRRSFR
ncbi:acyl-CoA carboxylase subunit epsilon [Arthrobacter sp. zg-Y820]|uniref:acyl-CoA carboxylase subunit epsilon n=1 Tax=unclassified Arthrobacter TaxID=235627 RepID=UPI00253F66A4|nr:MULTISPECIES: acyl-CoA carboxylase subunit epsilon [unclassified Arthrobacter]MCC9198056.1 acyl-CoA carboxylase subunit epsilon [Arthrobacter sp. zg-Y820]MDK1280923.1 acyl-CoA carboxylase subunit epsilon [Arthrobacter sp. zg.Y820]MDK1360233.1 acyl-CoA carboxylase subunit epsilon [Arthrobacter sp. zg-Y1219]WIB10398.1 acyl-CoA carboxylase subunit epsilon [Arthrobacter sp. zg-Y820]